ncbi:HAMP domain-containing histidine kinase [Halobacillus salinarum]|uniref:histidine kinase n=1 Tax=Halobacillus salinarum TaxID=2932257 RepID=A0ABY4EHC9_9BACI|nr:HAMP domain-containing sensor histidine kinase [Halobacillus salinarum]UOQ43866.1 HAMP domain-containing histidine kinase [Halobacillus salinarum]
MSKQKNKPKTILQYWTNRYLITLLIGLGIIAAASLFWIRHITVENRLKLTHVVAEEIADRIVNTKGRILAGPLFSEILSKRIDSLELKELPVAVVVDQEGKIIVSNKKRNEFTRLNQEIPSSIYKNSQSVVILNDGDKAYVVAEPIKNDNDTIGYVILAQRKSSLASINQEYRLLAVMLISLGLLGWLVIYYLTKRLSKPINETVLAAKEVSEGNYEIDLSAPKEKELIDLTNAFKDMAQKLKTLEQMRNELLAGVTHDLKTPVTSISGLIQAVKDEIVDQDEAKEYLSLSLKEIERLQSMIADLLSFNTFVSGSLPISPSTHELQKVLKEIKKQWQSTEKWPPLELTMPSPPIEAVIDENRIKQVLINLLINAKQAMGKDGKLEIKLALSKNHWITVDVKDSGTGIPPEEESLIFERFYRGSQKKLSTRGLGLGLPFSRLLAKAHGGDLVLKKTSASGSTFTLYLPKKS